jgi:exopolysaccharide biosynthesis polyprenyl glycosylphosphotransferase
VGEIETAVRGAEAPTDAVPKTNGWTRPSIATIDIPGEFGGQSRRDSIRRRLLALADLVGLAATYVLMWALVPPDAAFSDRLALVGMLPVWVFVNKLLGLYDRDANLIHKSTLDELPKLALSIVLGSALMVLATPSLLGFEFGRAQALVFVLLALVLVPTLRGAVRSWVVRRYERERCVIVGSGLVADLVARKLAVHPEYGVQLVGLVDSHDPAQSNGRTTKLLGDLERFEEICREFRVERVVIAFSSLSHEELIGVIRTSKALSLKITVVPRLFEVIGHSVEVDQLEGMTLLGLRGFQRTRSSLTLKRGIDLVVASLGLLVAAPFLLLVAAAVKLTSPGPVLFGQRRIGRRNAPFTMYKFRTMVQGADRMKAGLAHLNEAEGPMFKIADDPRVTPVGRALRRTSLDELPQLWNVLRGEMSLVGPRPLVPSEDDQVIGYHRERLDLTPGLTGPWQVMGGTAIPFQEMIKLDYLYVSEWSLWNDVKLLIRTAPLVLRASGQ